MSSKKLQTRGLVVVVFHTIVISRTLSTPTEECWPGVVELPDYKSTFPNWKTNQLKENPSSVIPSKHLDSKGIDVLQVNFGTVPL
jgi:hypothetical protein